MQNEQEKKEIEAGLVSDEALASFNKDFSDLQERYKLKVLGIPLITPDGRILVSIQALPLVKEKEEAKQEHDTPVESPYNKD